MNKQAIWGIIGLMSAALIGIIVLQAYWINWSYQLSERQFSKDVFSSLNRVVDKLQRIEQKEEEKELELLNFHESTGIKMIGGLSRSDSLAILNGSLETQSCQCPDCQQKQFELYKRKESIRERRNLSKLLNPEPIEDRIELEILDDAIRTELKNRNISLSFNYGVYSQKEKSLVINDGHYVVTDSSPQTFNTATGWKTLYDSMYRVNLYPSDVKSPGLLMIYFPGKVGLFWGGLWKTLSGAVIFTLLILFCFAYTVRVIFFQKKVGEMKTDFINNMTHEFKTPIATISLAADSITSPMISGNVQKVTRFANIIKEENKRMNSQVEKVLQMALLDKKDFNLKFTSINIHEVINLAVDNTSLQVERKSGTVKAFLKATKPVIKGDMTHVTNIIHNLLDNANKYSPDEPDISVHTRDVQKGVQVIVEDKGMGMTKEAKKHIFDKFYRVHTGNRHDVKGFGLGLSYVKAMITAHNGQIDVKSELGKGSKFIITFPH